MHVREVKEKAAQLSRRMHLASAIAAYGGYALGQPKRRPRRRTQGSGPEPLELEFTSRTTSRSVRPKFPLSMGGKWQIIREIGV